MDTSSFENWLKANCSKDVIEAVAICNNAYPCFCDLRDDDVCELYDKFERKIYGILEYNTPKLDYSDIDVFIEAELGYDVAKCPKQVLKRALVEFAAIEIANQLVQ